MFKLLKNLRTKQWLMILIAFILIVGQVWLELKMPDYMSQITVLVQTEGSQMSEIVKNGAYMLSCALGSLVFAIFTGYMTASVAAEFSKSVRKKIFTKVERLAMHEIKQFSTSSLITRSTNDVTQIQMFVAMGIQLLIKAPLTAIWAITKILNKSWQWSAMTAVAVGILLTVIGILIAIVMPKFKKVQKLIDKVNGVIRENLTGIRVVRAFNAERYQEDKFEDVKAALNAIGVNGLTVSQVMGCGIQRGYKEIVRGMQVDMQMQPKIKFEIVVSSEEWEEKTINAIQEAAFTGETGDGKIFSYEIRTAQKIRTKETGYDAIQATE